MTKTKIERIASIEQEIEQLKNRQKLLQQQHNEQERKARTKRLCKRMGLLESMLPDTIALTDEQFKSFLEKSVANEYGRKMLASISGKSGTGTGADEGNSARVSANPHTLVLTRAH
jgi:chromosome segregation ATPase